MRTGRTSVILIIISLTLLVCVLGGVGWYSRTLDAQLLRELQTTAARTPAAQAELESLRAAAERAREAVQPMQFSIGVVLAGLGGLLAGIILSRYGQSLETTCSGLETEVLRRSRQLVKTRNAIIFGLAKLSESRDDDTGRHLERVCAYVEILAVELSKRDASLTPEFIATLRVTASLHDIGKVGIPDSVLMKPGKLTPTERQIIQQHTLIGGDCLLAIRSHLEDDGFLDSACEVAFAHHERWDGGGYPFGLKGDEIPLAARIVALADTYDALTTRRVYKPAMPHQRAVEIIVSERGKQFDPAIVDAFVAQTGEFERTSQELPNMRPADVPRLYATAEAAVADRETVKA